MNNFLQKVKILPRKERKICIVYGNCHVGGIIKILNKMSGFTDEYVIHDIGFIQNIDINVALKRNEFARCDLFIYQPIRNKNRFGWKYSSDFLLRQLKDECITIAIPNLYNMPKFLFPQFIDDKFYGYRLIFEKLRYTKDSIIEDGIKAGKSIREIASIYYGEHTYDCNILEKKKEEFKNKLTKREEAWDIKISDFLRENLVRNKLFYDPGHPTEMVIQEISRRILDYLDIDFNIDELRQVQIIPLIGYEMPISESVKSCFKLKYDLKLYRKNYLCLGRKNLYCYIINYYALMWENIELSKNERLKSFVCFIPLYIVANIYRFPYYGKKLLTKVKSFGGFYK